MVDWAANTFPELQMHNSRAVNLPAEVAFPAEAMSGKNTLSLWIST